MSINPVTWPSPLLLSDIVAVLEGLKMHFEHPVGTTRGGTRACCVMQVVSTCASLWIVLFYVIGLIA